MAEADRRLRNERRRAARRWPRSSFVVRLAADGAFPVRDPLTTPAARRRVARMHNREGAGGAA